MQQTTPEFFHDFRQEFMAGAEAHDAFQLSGFMEAFSGELIETGFIEGFELCHYRAPRRACVLTATGSMMKMSSIFS